MNISKTPHKIVGTEEMEFALRVQEPIQKAELRIGEFTKKYSVLSPTEVIKVTLVPVRSNKELPKDRLMDCMEVISSQIISGSVELGAPVIKDILGLGVDIVVCRTIPYSFSS